MNKYEAIELEDVNELVSLDISGKSIPIESWECVIIKSAAGDILWEKDFFLQTGGRNGHYKGMIWTGKISLKDAKILHESGEETGSLGGRGEASLFIAHWDNKKVKGVVENTADGKWFYPRN